jgi:hypothetical protein
MKTIENPFEAEIAKQIRPQFEICYSRTQDPEEIFRIGWLCGMMRAAEIEANSHPKRNVSDAKQSSKEKP